MTASSLSLPQVINIGQVWSCIRRDRCWCIATLRSSLEEGEPPRGHLEPGHYNGGFLKVTEVTDQVPVQHVLNAITRHNARFPNPQLTNLGIVEFKKRYVIHRHYETTMD